MEEELTKPMEVLAWHLKSLDKHIDARKWNAREALQVERCDQNALGMLINPKGVIQVKISTREYCEKIAPPELKRWLRISPDR